MNFKTLTMSGVVAFSLLFTGCGDTFNDSKDNKDKDKEESISATKTMSFSDYATNSVKWEKIETLFGADPAVDPALSVQHGTKKLYRTIYKSPKNASIGTEGYPDGTMFVKELRTDDDGDLGVLAGATTVMIKEKGQWKFIKLSPDLKTTQAMGTQDGTNEVASVAGCIGCHAQANEGDDFTFPPSDAVVDREKGLADFKSYEKWTLIEQIRGIDPAGVISDKHGNGANLFRKIYKKQLTPKVNGQYPIGTIFLKELRMPKEDNKTIGELAGAITVMVKRDAGFDTNAQSWEYFMVNLDFTEIIKQGDSTSEATKGCFGCHTAAQSIAPKKKNNDFIFPRTKKETPKATTPTPVKEEDSKESKGKELYKSKGCVNCHGEKGEGVSGPRLSNQSSSTLKEKLTARKNGTAGGGIMKGIASGLTTQDIENLTTFIPTLNN